MKALSLKEPYATLIATGQKTIETRTWATRHRGELLIVGSQIPKGRFSGRMACIVNVLDCRPMTAEDEQAACCPLYAKAMAWPIELICLVEPAPIRGQLRLFDVPNTLIWRTGQTERPIT